MAKPKEKVLLVESDPVVSDLIARQALGSQGYTVKVVAEASSAIKAAADLSPDVVIANLELPGLSGKDFMAVLSSQNIQIPVIMLAPQGQEKDVIQAFRLGASDYVSTPVREAEIVSAVERAFKTVRARRERQELSRQLENTNKELQKKVNELTTIFSVGKAVTSITNQNELFDKIVEGAVKITQADYGWLLILDENSKNFELRAQKNLPKSLTANMNKPWDDGISSLVAVSGETFSIFGKPLSGFSIASLGKSALVTPVKVGKQVISLMVVMRKKPDEFDKGSQAMLEAVSDYASISMANARLFRALDERAASLQRAMEASIEGEKVKDEIIQKVRHELSSPLSIAKELIAMILDGEMGDLSPDQLQAVETTGEKMKLIGEIVQAIDSVEAEVVSAPA